MTEPAKKRRGFGRWLDDKYYDITSIVRDPKHLHHGRLIAGDLNALMVLVVLMGLRFLLDWPKPDEWTRELVQVLAIILGVLVANEVARRIPLVEILDAVAVLASAVARKGMTLAGTEVKLPGFLQRKETTEKTLKTETVEDVTPTPREGLPEAGGVTE